MAAAQLGVFAVSIALAGCTPSAEVASTMTSQPTPTVWHGAPDPAMTLHQYVVDHKIAESRFRRDDPGTPRVDFASPPGWSNAGDRTPDWAYGAIVYDKPKNPADPPFMIAIASRLTGGLDAEKVLEYAPAQLNELPGFEPRGEPTRSSFSGFEAMDYVGTFVGRGERQAIGQITIVVPGDGTLFVLQLNAVAPKGEEQVVIDAVRLIVEQTRISAPS